MDTNRKRAIALFENEPVRRIWLEQEEKWLFNVIDVMHILTGSIDAGAYWRKLKERLNKEGNESVTKCHGLKLIAKDGKMRVFDMADTETLLRLIQSVPSPKAEPFKLWLAKVGYERMREIVDPEIGVNRARKNWRAMGRSGKWIEQRMRGQEIRNQLTDYWADHKISKEEEFAALTNIIHKEWSGLTVREHKDLKKLQDHNLRDNMTDEELVFTSLAEMSTRYIAEKDRATGFDENSVSAKKGGGVANRARKDFENLTGQKVVSDNNFLSAPEKRPRLARAKH